MIVTVTAMFMMQVTLTEIIDMISMRNPRVPAINMIASALHRRTGSRILLTDGEHMLVVMLVMREVQMPFMQRNQYAPHARWQYAHNQDRAYGHVQLYEWDVSLFFPLSRERNVPQITASSLPGGAGVACTLFIAGAIPKWWRIWDSASLDAQ